MDEGRKRVLLIAASILAARKLAQYDGAVAQPHVGSALSRSGSSARTMGQAARREERAQWISLVAFPILGDSPQGCVRVTLSGLGVMSFLFVRKSFTERA